MTAALLPSPTAPRTGLRKRFTQPEVEHMLDLGLFDGQRLELIHGDLIDKRGQNPTHSLAIRCIAAWLAELFGFRRVLVQAPVHAALRDRDSNLPEPDVAVVAEHLAEYAKRHLSGSELLLAVEVAHSSLRVDRTTKRRLYPARESRSTGSWISSANG